MNARHSLALAGLFFLLFTACSDSTDQPAPASAAGESKRPSLKRMALPDPDAATTGGPTEVAVALRLDGREVAIARILECVGMPGRGLGFSATTADHKGDGSAGVRVGGGFEGQQSRVMVMYRSAKWTADANTGNVTFERTDTRTSDGHSFVTITATGEVEADEQALPFSLTVTCAPAGAWSSRSQGQD